MTSDDDNQYLNFFSMFTCTDIVAYDTIAPLIINTNLFQISNNSIYYFLEC